MTPLVRQTCKKSHCLVCRERSFFVPASRAVPSFLALSCKILALRANPTEKKETAEGALATPTARALQLQHLRICFADLSFVSAQLQYIRSGVLTGVKLAKYFQKQGTKLRNRIGKQKNLGNRKVFGEGQKVSDWCIGNASAAALLARCRRPPPLDLGRLLSLVEPEEGGAWKD